MSNYKIKIIEDKEHMEQIVNELRNEYGVQRKGDTYMSEERLQKKYDEFLNKELEVAGVFVDDELAGFVSYKITPEGLYGDNILVFEKHRGLKAGTLLVRHIEKYAKAHHCSQIYFGARRSANNFYFKLGFEGTCLIQSDKATKQDLENLMKKYGISDYTYSIYDACTPPVNQIWVDAKHIQNAELVKEIDNSDLDIGCLLTFAKKFDYNKNNTL